MKKVLAPLVVLFSISAPAFATPIKNAKCSDMAAIHENVVPEYFAVVDGYNKAGKKVSEEIDMGSLVSESKKVRDKCAKSESAKIETVRKDIKTAKTNPQTTATINPTKAKCKDFVALSEEVQPIAVYWVAGNEKFGKLKSGEVDEEFLAQPIATLVEECKAQPTASFYGKTKAWFKKHI